MDVATISVPRLTLSFIPVAVVVILMWRWSQDYGRALQAIARMLVQLTGHQFDGWQATHCHILASESSSRGIASIHLACSRNAV